MCDNLVFIYRNMANGSVVISLSSVLVQFSLSGVEEG